VERFGIVEIALARVVDGDRLNLVSYRWFILGIPLPKSLLPRGVSFETQREVRFCFEFTIALPIVGNIGPYQGTLRSVKAAL
jgi:hypothetical protein